MAATGYLDPELLPFTAEELFRGLALATDEQQAREVSDLFAEMLGGGADEGVGWSLPDVVFAAMGLVSDDLRKRVDAYKRAEWEGMRRSLVRDALRGEGLPSGSDPGPSVLRAADAELARYIADWEQGCAALAEWVRRRQVGEPVGDEPPPWPGQVEGAE
ncbi:hypothetical protein [Longimicrobium sp.]|uniref:hypothetical protein n=1 Tax=Longimicrobium sp. TaxID=2029185 RepID=UPI002E2FAA97|nr:hypothetical protein [Longimicrobium sp.]HEX6038937.1 hypothetical protein [Longimicrobium sp.]